LALTGILAWMFMIKYLLDFEPTKLPYYNQEEGIFCFNLGNLQQKPIFILMIDIINKEE
jgi:hypothetical protein